ncbi:13640_t:CDS:2, partial [Funneliformis geosporum]
KVKEEMNIAENIELSPHTLRRCFATHQAISGMPLPVLQKVLGHTSGSGSSGSASGAEGSGSSGSSSISGSRPAAPGSRIGSVGSKIASGGLISGSKLGSLASGTSPPPAGVQEEAGVPQPSGTSPDKVLFTTFPPPPFVLKIPSFGSQTIVQLSGICIV